MSSPRETQRFTIPDYIIFTCMLLVSAAIGIYFGVVARRRQKSHKSFANAKDFLLGNREMGWLPVSMSLIASFISAITLLGTPTETYNYGTQYCMIGLAYFIVVPVSAHLYMPIFYKLRLTSAYEYLSMRFNNVVRVCGCLTFMIHMTLYTGIVLYAPSLALQALTGINLWIAIISIATVCTFYTAIGGMKAVLWTDTFQISIMISGVIAVLIQGSINIGGFQKAVEISQAGQRIELFNWDPNPLTRHTFWSTVFGGAITWTAIYAVNQAQIQRALSCRTLRTAQIAYYINIPGLFFFMALTGMAGLVIYANYRDCDPLQSGRITKADQILPLFVLDSMAHMPGLSGLFTSGIFSGALSTMSSTINSLVAVVLSDFFQPVAPNFTARHGGKLTKILTVFFGAFTVLMVVLIANVGEILEAALALFGCVGGPFLGLMTLGIFFPWANCWTSFALSGVLGGPFLGLFTLGIFFPWVNTLGAMAGLVTSLGGLFYIAVHAKLVYKLKPKQLPISVAGCAAAFNTTMNEIMTNTTQLMNSTTTDATSTFSYNPTLASEADMSINATTVPLPMPEMHEEDVHWVFRISYLWYSVIGVVVCVVVGNIVSLITCPQDPKKLDPRLISPYACAYCCVGEEFIDDGGSYISRPIDDEEDITMTYHRNDASDVYRDNYNDSNRNTTADERARFTEDTDDIY